MIKGGYEQCRCKAEWRVCVVEGVLDDVEEWKKRGAGSSSAQKYKVRVLLTWLAWFVYDASAGLAALARLSRLARLSHIRDERRSQRKCPRTRQHPASLLDD